MLVKKVEFVNDKVKIVLDKESFYISKENYIENPLAIDSNITGDRINYLLEREKVINAKIEIIKVLNKKVLTRYEVYTYLKNKELENKDINKLIDNLMRIGLINDSYTSGVIVNSLIGKRKGRLEIIKVLTEKGIENEVIEKTIKDIDEEIYKENFNKVYEKYLKMHSNKSYVIKEQMIKNKLREYGYEEVYINNLEFNKDNDEEIITCKRYLQKLLKNKNIDLNSRENVKKIKIKLSAKGFSYDIISLVLKEVF